MKQHLSWPKHHHSTALKVMRELNMECTTTFLKPSSTVCCTPLTMPSSMFTPSNFSSNSDHPFSEVTNGMDLTLWEQMWAFHSLPTTWAPVTPRQPAIHPSFLGQCCSPPQIQGGTKHTHGQRRGIPNWQLTVWHMHSPQPPVFSTSHWHLEPSARPKSDKPDRLHGILGSLLPTSREMTRKTSPMHATMFQGNSAEWNNKP